MRVELDSVRRQTDALTQELRREINEQRTAHEQRVDELNEAVAAARTSMAEQRSEIQARQRENINLTTLNASLSVRIDKTQAALASTDARLLALNAQRTAEQREWVALQAMMTARLADKDALIASFQQSIVEVPDDPEAPTGNNTGGL